MTDRKVLIGDPLTQDHTPWTPGDRVVNPDGTGLSLAPQQIIYQADGTFTKAPYVAAGYTMVDVEVCAGGGGGGGGETGAALTLRRGGGGGGGGGYSRRRMLLSDLPDEVMLIVGIGGAGGAADTDGLDAGPSFWYYGGHTVYAAPGKGGYSGDSVAANSNLQAYGGPGDLSGLHGAVSSDSGNYDGHPASFYYPAAEFPGTPIPKPTISGVQYPLVSYFGAAGGAGGSIDVTDTFEGDGSNGTPGGVATGGSYDGPSGGGAPGQPGQDGTGYQPIPLGYMGAGAAGGGGAARATGGPGGNGGAGAQYSAGGGGGGAGTTGEGGGGSGGAGFQGLIVLWLS